MAKRFVTWLLLFIGITFILQSFQGPIEEDGDKDDIVLTTSESSYSPGEDIVISIQNNLDQTLQIPSDCPSEPLQVERYENGVWELQSSDEGLYVACGNETSDQPVFVQQPEFITLSAQSVTEVDYDPWKSQLFSEFGQYRVTLTTQIGDVEKTFYAEFEVEERGFFSSIAYHVFFRPIYNLMMFLTSIMPGYRFGLAIIAMTILIRLILLAPNQKALKAQQSMMKIQPELEEIKKKYAGNQEKIAQETMLIWKKHKVNPVGGCLPLLLQLPILIALFYVVRSGFTPYQGYILYTFLETVDLAKVSTDFFGIIDLQDVSIFWLPVIVGLLQFTQLKLSFARRKKSKHGKEVIDVGDKKKEPQAQDPMQMMSKSMMYFMPVMIGLMVASLPSGVGIYMMVSTLFGIVQQYVVNKAN